MSLELRSVAKRFGGHGALRGVSLCVQPGDCYGFIGHNGAGKTTAMRIALGLQWADAGQVLVDGFDAAEHPVEARARMGGLIEVPGFHGALDGAENLRLLGRLRGMGRGEAKREANRLLDMVGLTHAGGRAAGGYSQGMRQRLGIAQAILGRPSYVLLDEPTNGLDPEGIAEIRTVLRRLVDEEGLTVLVSSHQLNELAEICNRVGVLREGELLIEEETDVLLERGRAGYELRTSDPDSALVAARTLGVEGKVSSKGGAGARVDFDLGETAPEALTGALGRAGVPITAFAPRSPSLEEIYLRFTGSGGRGDRDGDAVAAIRDWKGPEPSEAPDPRSEEGRAKRSGIGRVARYELRRRSRRWVNPALLVIPSLVGGLEIWRRSIESKEQIARVESGELFSSTAVTAFEATARGLSVGLPILAFILAGVASQSIAGELSRGTLRNVLLRPVRRRQVVLGKGLALMVELAFAFALLAASCLGVAGFFFDFGDVVEILPNGEPYALMEAGELVPELKRALLAPILPLMGITGVGFLCGALVRSGAAALGLAMGSLVALDLSRVVARGYDLEGWLPSAHLPSPLGDTSFIAYFADRATGVSNALDTYGDMGSRALPPWILVPILLTIFFLNRRSVS